MVAKQTFIKKIIRDDNVNVKVLVLNTIFGSSIPGPYDPNKIYNKGDVISRVNEQGIYELLVAIRDNVTGPFDENDWMVVSFTSILKDSTIINQNSAYMRSIQEGMADDISNIVFNLAGLLDNDMDFNQLFRENFKNNDNLNIIRGTHEMGSMVSDENGLEFMLFEAKGLNVKPEKFKLRHHMEMVGIIGLECELTFNGLDDEPFWFNANDAILDGSFFNIPEFEKQEEIPYALNFRIKCNCNPESSIKISDFMVVFI